MRGKTRLACYAVAAGAAMALSLTAEENPQAQRLDERPRFEISVDMVGLSLTVQDQNRRLVTDLDQENFAVYEDGAQQKIEVFTKEDLPLRMVILLDTSASMQMKLALAQEAAIQFVRSLKPEDQLKVLEFNDRVLTLVDFTANFEEIAQAIRATEASGATSLYNAIYIALRSLSSKRERRERQAVVVLSDGADTRSLLAFEDVLEQARKTDVVIHTIFLRGTEEDLKKDKYFQAKYVLEKLAAETGGTAYSPARIEDLAGAYDRIAAELKSQYNLGYVSSNSTSDGAWRRIQVLCNRAGHQVRTRTGYYAPRRRVTLSRDRESAGRP